MAATALAFSAGCTSVPPPRSPVPDAAGALGRLRSSAERCTGIQATAKVDYFGDEGRGRGDVWLFASWPARLRMDVFAFGNLIATLTSDGTRFGMADLRSKAFYVGEPKACAIGQFTQVPIPAHALVSLLRGQAPILKHAAAAATLEWDRHGYYRVRLEGADDTHEELHLEPRPDDLQRPWTEQRMRIVGVVVRQHDDVLYDAEMSDFGNAPMATGRVDPDGIDPPTPPSGPSCTEELPRKIHVRVPSRGQDVQFRFEKVTWNPPLPQGTFAQAVPQGSHVVQVTCP
jgi:hypothetical protein